MKTLHAIFILSALSISAFADVINVPADTSSIQAGINSASTGDTVLVSEGTYFENISFLGKEITVASKFILEGDTSWISKTVIDGSKPVHSDTASVVRMVSGETVNSVLQGFTITGGNGTFYQLHVLMRLGGGIVIYQSGGTILNNVIAGNKIKRVDYPGGGGMAAWISRNGDHTIIIRENKITDNKIDAGGISNAGGLLLVGGEFYIERNEIMFNEADANGTSMGGGLMWYNMGRTARRNLYISENTISNNTSSSTSMAIGGGLVFGPANGYDARVFNNIITDNFSQFYGGGILFVDGGKYPTLYNNTLFNNEAGVDGNSLGIGGKNSSLIIYNNIIWGKDNKKPNIDFGDSFTGKVWAYHNILKEPFGPEDPVISIGNLFMDPMFQTDSYELADSSPAIGRAIDSVMFSDNMYYMPETDFAGNLRPNPVDAFADFGAFESKYQWVPLSIADLSHIEFYDYELSPAFHIDSLSYLLQVDDTVTSADALQAIPADPRANLDINYPTDFGSLNAEDWTASITVTSSDGSTTKIYTLVFDKIVNIDDRLTTDNFRIYPNPANESLTIETNRPGLHSIELYSLSGHLMYSTEAKGSTHQINLSHLGEGIYFITVRSRDQVWTEKIIKL